jgi:hypothetical protein
MVRTSERKKLINALEDSIQEDIEKLAANLALDDGEYDLESSDDEFGENGMIMNDIEDKAREIKAILAKRYLIPRSKIEKAPPISEFLLTRLEDKRFKQQFRMHRDSFVKLCNLVSTNPVFHNNSNCPQRPVADQMMVALWRLGCFGNGASVGMIATFLVLEKEL